MRVFMTGNCSVPRTLLAALVQRAPAFTPPIEIAHLFTLGNADYVAPGMERFIRVNTLFIGANVRPAVNEGRADFTPCFLSEIPGLFRRRHPAARRRAGPSQSARSRMASAALASRSA